MIFLLTQSTVVCDTLHRRGGEKERPTQARLIHKAGLIACKQKALAISQYNQGRIGFVTALFAKWVGLSCWDER